MFERNSRPAASFPVFRLAFVEGALRLRTEGQTNVAARPEGRRDVTGTGRPGDRLPDESSAAPAGLSLQDRHSPGARVADGEGLKLIEKALREAVQAQRRLDEAVRPAVARRDAAHRELDRALGSSLQRMRSRRIAALEDQFAAASRDLHEVMARAAACRVGVAFDFDAPPLQAFERLAAAHVRLAKVGSVWSLRRDGDAILRVAASVGMARSGVLVTAWPGLRLMGAEGEELDLFPGLWLLRGPSPGGAGTLVVDDLRALHVEASSVQLVEEGEVPGDAADAVQGHIWSTTGEEARGDAPAPGARRLPVLRYGQLFIHGPGGLNLTFVTSQVAPAEEFARAFKGLQDALRNAADRSTREALVPVRQPDAATFAAAERVQVPPVPFDATTTLEPPKGGRKRPVAWAAAILGAVLLGGGAVVLLSSESLMPPATMAPTSEPPSPHAAAPTEPASSLEAPPVAASASTREAVATPSRSTASPAPAMPLTAPPTLPPPSQPGTETEAAHGSLVEPAPEPTPEAAPRQAPGRPGAEQASLPLPSPSPPESIPAPDSAARIEAPPDLPAPPAPPPEPPAAPPERAAASDRFEMPLGANVRAEPNGGARILRTVNSGTPVRLFERQGDWLLIGQDRPWGWVHTSRAEPARQR